MMVQLSLFGGSCIMTADSIALGSPVGAVTLWVFTQHARYTKHTHAHPLPVPVAADSCRALYPAGNTH